MQAKKSFTLFFVLLAVALLLGGCAPAMNATNVNNQDYQKPGGESEVQLLNTDLYAYTGLLETKAIKKRTFTVLKIDMSFDKFKELFPGRTTYYAWVVNLKTGKEFFVQGLFSGFEENFEPFLTAVIDGDESTGLVEKDCKLIVLSTAFKYGYDIGGRKFPVDSAKFAAGPDYRRDIVDKYGDLVSEIKKVANGKELVEDILQNWSYFERNSDGARFYTSLSEERMKQLAKLNPQYNFWDKFKYNARLSIAPLNYVATAVNLGFDILNSAMAPSWGADFDSVISREDFGFALAYLDGFYRKNADRAAEVRVAQILAEMKGSEDLVSSNENVRVQPVIKKEVVQEAPQKVEPVKIAQQEVSIDKVVVAQKKTSESHETIVQNVEIAHEKLENKEVQKKSLDLEIPNDVLSVFSGMAKNYQSGQKTTQTDDKNRDSLSAQNVWDDYAGSKLQEMEVVSQLEKNLPALEIPREGIEAFRQLAQFQEFKWGTIRTGDRVLAVAMNGKVIYRDATVNWKNGDPLSVRIYKLVNKQTNKLYSIGQAVSGHWVRFE